MLRRPRLAEQSAQPRQQRQRLIGSRYGLAIAHVIVALPFVLIVLQAGLHGLDRNLEAAAEGLGSGRLTTIRRIAVALGLAAKFGRATQDARIG